MRGSVRQDAARAELTERLRSNLSKSVVDRFIGGTHTQRFSDNLLPGFNQEQIAALSSQLAAGGGGELRSTRTGKRRAHAPYSSAAMAINAFGRWLGHEPLLAVRELSGFVAPL